MGKYNSQRKATRGSGFSVHSEGAKRLQPLAVCAQWADVPAEVIKSLVVAYAGMGDAILFGTSQDRQVMALRVYRGGGGYSVYARKLADLDSALDRLDRYCPAMRPIHRVEPPLPHLVQVKSTHTKPIPDAPILPEPEIVHKTPISSERLSKLGKILADAHQDRVDKLIKEKYPELAQERGLSD